ncbi:hypothetical protein DPMN_188215 [Dreissena polymorpha]|uniref:Uncharacterized protein n=1 Tax=Dreissena polymorpha TaxID=45954 RepID=A0A9D4DSI2_DREPO|nr:hypothetical protein DPMN_188215 [Dreissena polymorpha]
METVEYDEDGKADDETLDWVNIFVPIAIGVLFVLVIVWLYKTKKEVPVETQEKIVAKIPVLNRCMTTEWIVDETTGNEKAGNEPCATTENCIEKNKEKQPFAKTKIAHSAGYDTLVEEKVELEP